MNTTKFFFGQTIILQACSDDIEENDEPMDCTDDNDQIKLNTIDSELWFYHEMKSSYPPSMHPENMLAFARAGFYHYYLEEPFKDAVKCIKCGLVAANFPDESIPLITHARFQPDCEFLNSNYPPDFIKLLMDEFVPELNGKKLKLDEENRWAKEKDPLIHKVDRETQTDIPEKRVFGNTNCIVCLTAERKILLYPCKHFALCETCVRRLDVCPCCRTEIEKIELIYNV